MRHSKRLEKKTRIAAKAPDQAVDRPIMDICTLAGPGSGWGLRVRAAGPDCWPGLRSAQALTLRREHRG